MTNTKVKIAHLADSHLRDTQFQLRMRGQDFTHAVLDVVRKSAAENVDVIIHAGDMLDTLRPTSRTIQDLQEISNLLVKCKLQMLVIRGNHDFTEPPWHSLLNTEDSRYGFVCIDKKMHTIEKDGLKLTILGMPFMQKEDFLETIRGKTADVLVWHGMIAEFVSYPVQEVVSLADLPLNKFKLVAMGDIHEAEARELDDGTVVAYPGSTEMCNRKEAIDKSFYIHEFELKPEGNELVDMRVIPIAARRIIALHVDSNETIQEVIAKTNDAITDQPMVLVTYHPDFPDTPARLKAGIDTTRCILRASLKRPHRTGFQAVERDEDEKQLSMLDFLPKFLTPGTKVFEVGQLLLDPKAEAKAILDKYVEEVIERVTT
jgi:DNA repair protein SbcD/Mre11